MLRNQNGITLVALVITIVILIILATVSISFAVNGGLFDKAQRGADMYKDSAEDEAQTLNVVDKSFSNLMYKYTNGTIQ